ncbi:DNA ligase D [Chitinophaga pendula]|uniref:DNA ligase D n=1 Tax=Chitinophaga TaxID=79328 RepID=UPI000BB0357C|nr:MULTISPECIES: DNA ligase D [Chitinophaga]ASZ10596.1 DNA ligase D [Chitinophaga sp. MD30]UCJ06428.1 DNA ligase D [Chitinophaga pendula]
MSLSTYRKKRDFSSTAEPTGGKKRSKQHQFVIQRHHATALHYDFRLEVDGILKSWAVPKGPSLDPQDKRLAMEVEDHPYDYKDFEGTIPAGNYGAGNVYIWDKGTFELLEPKTDNFDKEALKDIKAGSLKVILKGKKLKGEFALVKMKGRGERSWLLIKHRDKYAVDGYDSEEHTPQRVKDKGIQVKEAAKESKKKVHVKKPEATEVKAVTPKRQSGKHKLKAIYRPMLTTLVDAPFDRDGWIFETKWDGYRAIAAVNKGKVALYSRNQVSFDEVYPPIVAALSNMQHNVVLDGEVVVLDKQQQSDFQALQNYKTTGKGNLCYVVFDLLHLDGNELQALPLLQRKALLDDLLAQLNDKRILFSAHLEHKGLALFKKAQQRGWEGIIAKDGESIYEENRRGNAWLKIKIIQQQEAVICGYTEPRGSRKQIGALILAVYEKDTLRYVGHCGGGLNTQLIDDLYRQLQPLRRKTSPLQEKVKVNMPVTWVEPKLVCEVKFSSWTADGILRQPIFMGLRVDKPVKEVHQETAKSLHMGKAKKTATSAKEKTSDTAEKERALSLNGHQVALTNQQKIYWPKEKITKGQMIDYYLAVADYLLPHIKDRPLSLNRFPNGITGASFYQKDLDLATVPGWIKSIPIHSDSSHKDVDYLLCNNAATLAYMANLGCIEINPWLSRTRSLDQPDFIVLDLDPEGISFRHVVETALCIKEILDGFGLHHHCKTSGSSGLHIYIPTGAKYNYDSCRLFAEYVAKQTQRQLPDITSVIRAKSQRKKKVYIDYLQNSRGQTVAAPYSVRPKPGATVSAPLLWEEVNSSLRISDFDIWNMPDRIKEKGELWKDIRNEKNDLRKVIRQIEKAPEVE